MVPGRSRIRDKVRDAGRACLHKADLSRHVDDSPEAVGSPTARQPREFHERYEESLAVGCGCSIDPAPAGLSGAGSLLYVSLPPSAHLGASGWLGPGPMQLTRWQDAPANEVVVRLGRPPAEWDRTPGAGERHARAGSRQFKQCSASMNYGAAECGSAEVSGRALGAASPVAGMGMSGRSRLAAIGLLSTFARLSSTIRSMPEMCSVLLLGPPAAVQPPDCERLAAACKASGFLMDRRR